MAPSDRMQTTGQVPGLWFARFNVLLSLSTKPFSCRRSTPSDDLYDCNAPRLSRVDIESCETSFSRTAIDLQVFAVT